MPKIVDHEARRTEILEATWRVIVRDGIAAATIREIAREAGHSNGVLSHYFTNKDEIIQQTHRMAFHNAGLRAEARNVGIGGIEALRNALYESLPLDKLSQDEAALDASLWSQAMTDSELRNVRFQTIVMGRPWWTRMLQDARSRGEITVTTSDAVLCDRIQALIDGATVAAVLYPDMTPDRIRAMADSLIEDISR